MGIKPARRKHRRTILVRHTPTAMLERGGRAITHLGSLNLALAG